jgi:hypothetical protein
MQLQYKPRQDSEVLEASTFQAYPEIDKIATLEKYR